MILLLSDPISTGTHRSKLDDVVTTTDVSKWKPEDQEAVARYLRGEEVTVFGLPVIGVANTEEDVQGILAEIRSQEEVERTFEELLKSQREEEARRRARRAADLQRTIELADRIRQGHLHPGLLFDDQFQLRCPSPLGDCVERGIAFVTTTDYPQLRPKGRAVLEAAIQKIRAFKGSGLRMSPTEDTAVPTPMAKHQDVQEAITLCARIVAGEVDPSSLWDEEWHLLGPDIFRQWVYPGGRIDSHPLIRDDITAIIRAASRRIGVARLGAKFRTRVERFADDWLSVLRRKQELEDALYRFGSSHQRARYHAGFLDLEAEALPLIAEQAFRPLQSMNLSPYVEITDDEVKVVVEKGRFEFMDGSLPIESAIPWPITEQASPNEQEIMQRIKTLLPGSRVSLHEHQRGVGACEGDKLAPCGRRRNEIRVEALCGTAKVSRSFASPEPDAWSTTDRALAERLQREGL